MKARVQLFSILFFMLSPCFTKAQNKIGYINIQKLIALMPEAVTADSILKAYQVELGNKSAGLWKRTDSIVESLGCHDCGPLPDSVKNKRRRQVTELYQVAQNWQQTAQDLYTRRSEELIQPILKKATGAIEAIAKESNYNYVLDASGDTLLLSPANDDLLEKVKIRLGINILPGK